MAQRMLPVVSPAVDLMLAVDQLTTLNSSANHICAVTGILGWVGASYEYG